MATKIKEKIQPEDQVLTDKDQETQRGHTREDSDNKKAMPDLCK